MAPLPDGMDRSVSVKTWLPSHRHLRLVGDSGERAGFGVGVFIVVGLLFLAGGVFVAEG